MAHGFATSVLGCCGLVRPELGLVVNDTFLGVS